MPMNDPLSGSENLAERATQAKTVEASSELFSVLAINGGSSSIKFGLYQVGEPIKRGLYGKVDRIGLSGTNLTFTDPLSRFLLKFSPLLQKRSHERCFRSK